MQPFTKSQNKNDCPHRRISNETCIKHDYDKNESRLWHDIILMAEYTSY